MVTKSIRPHHNVDPFTLIYDTDASTEQRRQHTRYHQPTKESETAESQKERERERNVRRFFLFIYVPAFQNQKDTIDENRRRVRVSTIAPCPSGTIASPHPDWETMAPSRATSCARHYGVPRRRRRRPGTDPATMDSRVRHRVVVVDASSAASHDASAHSSLGGIGWRRPAEGGW